MPWDDELFALFDDLEAQAEAAFAADREVELADRTRAEYASVSFASRLMASVGTTVSLTVVAVGSLTGRLARVSEGWLLLESPSRGWIVPWPAVTSVGGASPRSRSELTWSPVTRLGLGSALRRLEEAGTPCVLHLTDESQLAAQLRRVGKDFVEVTVGEEVVRLVPFAAIAAVSSRE